MNVLLAENRLGEWQHLVGQRLAAFKRALSRAALSEVANRR
jgi:hypothetical protein